MSRVIPEYISLALQQIHEALRHCPVEDIGAVQDELLRVYDRLNEHRVRSAVNGIFRDRLGSEGIIERELDAIKVGSGDE